MGARRDWRQSVRLDQHRHGGRVSHNMSSNQPTTRVQGVPNPGESKPRGANRSTKVAGKLKVLPDQPEPPVPLDKTEPPPPPKRTEGEGSGTAEDSEDEGDDEAEADDTEEIEASDSVFDVLDTR